MNRTYKHVWKKFIEMLKQANLPLFWMLISMLAGIASSWFALKQPEYISEIVAGKFEVGFVCVMLLFSLGQCVCTLIANYIKNVTIAKIDRNMEKMASRKVLSLPVSTLEGQDPQKLISRITTDSNMLSTFLLDMTVAELPRLYYMISAFVILCRDYNIKLALAALLTIPLTVIGAFINGALIFGKADKVQAEISALTGHLSEKIVNLPLIKAYTNEERESREGGRLLDNLMKAKNKKAWIDQVNTQLSEAFGKLPNFFVTAVGAVLILNGEITSGIFVGYFLYASKVCTYVTEHIRLWISMKTAQGATYRLAGIMDEKEESQEGISEQLKGDVVFDHVTFAYGDKKILDDVSFTVEEGKLTAFVGYSGCGKTTALNLIERFYEPKQGKITVGGKDISQWGMKSYRDNIFYMSQNAPALDGTVRDTVTYGISDPGSEEEIAEAMRSAQAEEVVRKLGGLDYEIGSSGGKLSGGQKQRLSLVRAFLTKQKYLILDEPTSALDIEATKKVQEALFSRCKGKTVLMVAHNAATIKNADNIIVFKEGKVLAQGSHDELVKKCDFYNELLRTQGMEG